MPTKKGAIQYMLAFCLANDGTSPFAGMVASTCEHLCLLPPWPRALASTCGWENAVTAHACQRPMLFLHKLQCKCQQCNISNVSSTNGPTNDRLSCAISITCGKSRTIHFCKYPRLELHRGTLLYTLSFHQCRSNYHGIHVCKKLAP